MTKRGLSLGGFSPDVLSKCYNEKLRHREPGQATALTKACCPCLWPPGLDSFSKSPQRFQEPIPTLPGPQLPTHTTPRPSDISQHPARVSPEPSHTFRHAEQGDLSSRSHGRVMPFLCSLTSAHVLCRLRTGLLSPGGQLACLSALGTRPSSALVPNGMGG